MTTVDHFMNKRGSKGLNATHDSMTPVDDDGRCRSLGKFSQFFSSLKKREAQNLLHVSQFVSYTVFLQFLRTVDDDFFLFSLKIFLRKRVSLFIFIFLISGVKGFL